MIKSEACSAAVSAGRPGPRAPLLDRNIAGGTASTRGRERTRCLPERNSGPSRCPSEN
jgi:hypothetical protein